MNKDLIKTRFKKAQSSYASEATIQYQMARHLINQVNRFWSPGHSEVLEIGVGTGYLTELIRTELPIDHLMGNDIIESPPPALTGLIESGWLTYLPGDAETLLPPQPAYDAILSNATVQWLSSPITSLKKWLSWLRPGGLLAFTTFGPKHYALLKEITGKGLHYLPSEKLIKALKPQARCLWFAQKYQPLFFPSFIDMLKHIKASGSNALGPAFTSRSTLYQMAVSYEKQFPGHERYPLYYHPYWFIFQKIGNN